MTNKVVKNDWKKNLDVKCYLPEENRGDLLGSIPRNYFNCPGTNKNLLFSNSTTVLFTNKAPTSETITMNKNHLILLFVTAFVLGIALIATCFCIRRHFHCYRRNKKASKPNKKPEVKMQDLRNDQGRNESQPHLSAEQNFSNSQSENLPQNLISPCFHHNSFSSRQDQLALGTRDFSVNPKTQYPFQSGLMHPGSHITHQNQIFSLQSAPVPVFDYPPSSNTGISNYDSTAIGQAPTSYHPIQVFQPGRQELPYNPTHLVASRETRYKANRSRDSGCSMSYPENCSEVVLQPLIHQYHQNRHDQQHAETVPKMIFSSNDNVPVYDTISMRNSDGGRPYDQRPLLSIHPGYLNRLRCGKVQ